jgi:hypothetical protein
MKLLLPDALDSKLTNLLVFGDENSNLQLLRLRLYIIMQILFHGRILVPEGWALDSLAFLWVASEVIDAVSQINIPAIRNYSPFVMEVRREGNYIQILDEYMQRPNVRWSGFRPKLNKPGRCREIAKQLCPAVQGTAGFDLVTKVFAEHLD